MTTGTGKTRRWPRSSSAWRWRPWPPVSCSAASGPSASSSMAGSCPPPGRRGSGRRGCVDRRQRDIIPDIRCAKGAGSKARAWSPNAWHHPQRRPFVAGDAGGHRMCLFSVGQRWRIADPIAALVVAVFYFQDCFRPDPHGARELLERSLPDETEREILGIVTADPRVGEPHNLRTRRIGAAIAVEGACPCGRGA